MVEDEGQGGTVHKQLGPPLAEGVTVIFKADAGYLPSLLSRVLLYYLQRTDLLLCMLGSQLPRVSLCCYEQDPQRRAGPEETDT